MKYSSKKKIKVKYCIIVARVSGLSFARKINSDDYIIVEKSSDVGGYCKTIKKNGFVWDYGGHFFHFADAKIKKEFSNYLNSNRVIKNVKCTKIYYKNKYIDYPFQNNIHQLEYYEFIDCLYDLVVCSYKTKNIKTFYDMIIAMYGESISKKFLIPYNEKLYACNLNRLDKNAMGRFFPKSNFVDIIKGFKFNNQKTYNDCFYYSKNGAIDFVNEICKKVNKNKILLNNAVEKIFVKKHYIETNEYIIEYKYLISTIPYVDFAKILSFRSEKMLSANKVYVLNLGFDKDSLNKKIHWCYFPEKKYVFYRVGFYNNILHKNKMSLYVEVGSKNNKKINKNLLLKKVLSDLKKIRIITNHKLVDFEILEMSPAYVHISNDSQKIVNSKLDMLKNKGVFSIGRYGKWTYCSIEDCIIMAYKLAASLLNG